MVSSLKPGLWMPLILFYGAAKGGRELFKKKAYGTNSVTETLFVYILLSFLFVCPYAPSAVPLNAGKFLPWIILKAFLVFLAWLLGFSAVSRMPVSLYGVLDLSRVLFSTVLGVTVLCERPGAPTYAGLALVGTGLLLLKAYPRKKEDRANNAETDKKYILFSFGSAFLNACSGTLDKYLLGNTEITDNQLLFWYTLFTVVFYVIYVLARREHINFRTALKNPWIYLMALTFALGDKALFAANKDPGSTVAVMTVLKQSGCVVVIIGGKIVFREKHTAYKLFCAAVVTAGILIAALYK